MDCRQTGYVGKDMYRGVQCGYSSKSQIQLEKKEDMKARGPASPDLADTLAMSFSVTMQAKPEPRPLDPEEAYIRGRIANGFGGWI